MNATRRRSRPAVAGGGGSAARFPDRSDPAPRTARGQSRGVKSVNCVVRGDPGGSRTPNPQIRSLMLYPIELRGRCL